MAEVEAPEAPEASEVEEAAAALAPYEDAVLLEALKQVLEDRPSVVQELADWAVPDRAYANARLLLDNRISGTIKSYNETKGYGFIECPEVKAAFGNDVFLHFSQINGFGVGQEVSFAILVNSERKPQAFDLGPQGGKQDMRGKGAGAAAAQKGGASFGGKAAGGKAAAAPSAWGAADKGWKGDPWGGSKGDPWGGCKGDPWGGSKGKDPWAVDPWAAPACGGYGKGAAPAWGKEGAAAAWGKGPVLAKGGSKGKEKGKNSGASAGPPPETSMVMEGVTDRRFEGTVKSFNDTKGFGFIACEEIMETFGGDAFLHHRQYQGFTVGQEVSFEVFLNKDGKPQAKELQAEGGDSKRQKLG